MFASGRGREHENLQQRADVAGALRLQHQRLE
jgi:hypothetical protein